MGQMTQPLWMGLLLFSLAVACDCTKVPSKAKGMSFVFLAEQFGSRAQRVSCDGKNTWIHAV